MTTAVLRVCRACDRYTFGERCPKCSAPTRTPHPARYDPGDRYGKYRRMLLESVREPPSLTE
jgi:H/ACA ribonucleoprotein complex subunit 3